MTKQLDTPLPLGEDRVLKTAEPAEELLSPAELGWETLQQSYEKLLKSHCGKWVAFHGAEQVAIGATRQEVKRECERQGLPEDRYVIGQILPIIEEVPMGADGV
jgi:hypothetical protein